jgi:hypothetical protein
MKIFFFFWCRGTTRARDSSFMRLLHVDHTQRRTTFGRAPLDEWSAHRRDLYLATQNNHNRQTSMQPVGFEPTTSGGERLQTHALNSTATGTGHKWTLNFINLMSDVRKSSNSKIHCYNRIPRPLSESLQPNKYAFSDTNIHETKEPKWQTEIYQNNHGNEYSYCSEHGYLSQPKLPIKLSSLLSTTTTRQHNRPILLDVSNVLSDSMSLHHWCLLRQILCKSCYLKAAFS